MAWTPFLQCSCFDGATAADLWCFPIFSSATPNNRENIRILGGWEQQNIRVPISQLVGVQGAAHDGGVRFHRHPANQLRALWKAWDDANLIDPVLTWDVRTSLCSWQLYDVE